MASPFFGKNSELCLAMLLFLVSRNLNLSARSRTSPRGPRFTQHVVTRVAGQIDLEAKNHCRATSWYYQGQRCASSVCRAAFPPAVQQHRPPPSPPRISTVCCIKRGQQHGSPARRAKGPPAAPQLRPQRKSPVCRAEVPSTAPRPPGASPAAQLPCPHAAQQPRTPRRSTVRCAEAAQQFHPPRRRRGPPCGHGRCRPGGGR